jgi:hypothetical protein
MVEELIKYLNHLGLKVRIIKKNSLEMSSWNDWITTPEKGYIDIGDIPIRFTEISYIEIDCVKKVYIGKRIPPKEVSIRSEIELFLLKNDISYNAYNDNYIRVYMNLEW